MSEANKGKAKMKLANDVAGISFRGVQLDADKNGVVFVPDDLVQEALDHGLEHFRAEEKK
jgi:regulator of RNase E activity RraA